MKLKDDSTHAVNEVQSYLVKACIVSTIFSFTGETPETPKSQNGRNADGGKTNPHRTCERIAQNAERASESCRGESRGPI